MFDMFRDLFTKLPPDCIRPNPAIVKSAKVTYAPFTKAALKDKVQILEKYNMPENVHGICYSDPYTQKVKRI